MGSTPSASCSSYSSVHVSSCAISKLAMELLRERSLRTRWESMVHGVGVTVSGLGILCRTPVDVTKYKGHHRSLISISWTTYSPRRASRGASYGRKSERLASTRTRTSSLGARSFASRVTERHTGGAETKTSDSIGLERRNKRHGAPGDTGHLVACPLAGGASSWLGWVTTRPRGGRA